MGKFKKWQPNHQPGKKDGSKFCSSHIWSIHMVDPIQKSPKMGGWMDRDHGLPETWTNMDLNFWIENVLQKPDLEIKDPRDPRASMILKW